MPSPASARDTAREMNAEVCLKESSGNARVVADLRQRVLHLLDQKHRAGKPLAEGQELDFGNDAQLAQHVERICLRDVPAGPAPPVSTATVHVHHMYDEEAAEETAGGEGDDEGSVAFQMFLLPAREFEGLWETLLYETDIKERLLRYVATAMRFSEMGSAARRPQSDPLALHPARLLCLLRARLAALGGVHSQGEKPAHRAPRHRLGCLSEPPPKSPISPPSTLCRHRLSRHLVEQGGAAARAARHGQDEPVQGAGAEGGHPPQPHLPAGAPHRDQCALALLKVVLGERQDGARHLRQDQGEHATPTMATLTTALYTVALYLLWPYP